MRIRFLRILTNRVLIGAVAFFVLVGLWQFRWKPQYRPHYELGVASYQGGRYQDALTQFQQAYSIAPNSLDVIMMLGWAHYKLNRFEDARFFFDRALRINPNTQEAQLGSAFVALETGRGALDVDLIRQYLGNRGGDPGVRTLSAAALAKDGRWFEAAAIYRALTTDRDYGASARLALEEMFGLKGTSDAAPPGFPPLVKPEALQVRYWAGDGAFWQREGQEWRKLYVAGVNLGAAPPGYYPSRQLNDAAEYATWLGHVSTLEANVVRVYNLLPPAFYRAFRKHREAGGTLTLFQQIHVGDPPGRDLFDTAFVERTRADIRLVVDALNGRGEVPPGPGRGRGGIYDQDVADAVGAILLGRELEPSVVSQTNVLNAGERSHRGRYVQIAEGTPTEVWIARMLDYLVDYETQTYNRQRPVGFVNWPSLDPLPHPTEAPLLQELRTRMARGEQDLEFPSGPQDDDDVVAVDEAKLAATPAFIGGLFAAYHVYPHWPDFLLHEPELLAARDSVGPNPFYGYLRQLAARMPHPLLVAEYGVSNAMGVSHVHPMGWHHGGHDEAGQAALLARLARAVQEAGTAGGLVFALHDEWYKRNWLVRRFQEPDDRATLWLNDLDPDQRFGLIGFRPAKWKLFTGASGAWQSEAVLYRNTGRGAATGDAFDGARTLRSLQAAADEGYLYFRLVVDCLDCAPKERRPDGRPRFDKVSYALTLNTLPGTLGVQSLPWGNLTAPTGVNFVLLLTDEPAARLLAADNYNPYEVVPTPGIAAETDVRLRVALETALAPRGTFGDVTVEPNRRRYTRDGRQIEPARLNRSTLRYGIDEAGSGEVDTLGEWYADVKGSAILVRIPWGKLLVTDPSSHTVFAGFDDRRVRTARSPGIEVAAFALTPTGTNRDVGAFSVSASLPSISGNALGNVERLSWSTWDTVKPDVYTKRAYRELQAVFASQTDGAAATGAGPATPAAAAPAR
jgi:tetratricopeptide (TPR) repeat protein